MIVHSVLCQRMLAKPNVLKPSPMLSSKSFTVLDLMCRSLIHFVLISVSSL